MKKMGSNVECGRGGIQRLGKSHSCGNSCGVVVLRIED